MGSLFLNPYDFNFKATISSDSGPHLGNFSVVNAQPFSLKDSSVLFVLSTISSKEKIYCEIFVITEIQIGTYDRNDFKYTI